ncbi:MAG: hypothetical protein STSR0009_31800 [Methanoregula sp.]
MNAESWRNIAGWILSLVAKMFENELQTRCAICGTGILAKYSRMDTLIGGKNV